MERYWNFAQTSTGARAGGATITVYDAGTLVIASIFSDTIGTPKANPFVADSDGYFYFYAVGGRYKVQLSGVPIGLTPIVWDDILLINDYDVAILDTANTFTASQTIVGNLTVSGYGAFGTPAVTLITAAGKLAALTSDYLADLDASALLGLNATQLTSGTIPSARLAGTYSEIVAIANVANVFTGTRISLGASPADAGAVRLSYGDAVVSRNSGGTGNVELLRLTAGDHALLASAYTSHIAPEADDLYNLGETTLRYRNAHLKDTYITGLAAFGATPATAGALRLTNAEGLVWRNAANTANLTALTVNAANELTIGVSVDVHGDLRVAAADDGLYDLGDLGRRFAYGFFSTGVIIGASPATTGILRLSNGGSISWRNFANTGNVDAISVDGDNRFYINVPVKWGQVGSTGAVTTALGANAPAGVLTPAAPWTWLPIYDSAGNLCYFPVWK